MTTASYSTSTGETMTRFPTTPRCTICDADMEVAASDASGIAMVCSSAERGDGEDHYRESRQTFSSSASVRTWALRQEIDRLTRCLGSDAGRKDVPWGDLDPDIVPFVRELNRFPGVQTLQSCAGHGDDEYVDRPGGVWLHLRPDAVSKVLPVMDEIGQNPLIEQAGFAWGRAMEPRNPVLILRFQGNERGKLDESTSFVLETLRTALNYQSATNSGEDGRNE